MIVRTWCGSRIELTRERCGPWLAGWARFLFAGENGYCRRCLRRWSFMLRGHMSPRDGLFPRHGSWNA